MHMIRYTPTRFNACVPASVYGRSPWAGLESEIDRLFDATFTGFSGPSAGQFPVDFYEDENNTYVRAELPGLKREDLGVELADGVLTISGARQTAGDNGPESVSIRRSLSVPDEVAADKVSAAYENGVLTVTLPKREEAKPKKITVAVN